MLKYLGSVGTFIYLNDSINHTYNLLNIFSSSAATDCIFSASINNSSGAVVFNTASTSLYVNGVSASIVKNQQWSHISFSFDNKLWTYDTNNFLIRFGDTASSNFNIQNTYILESSFTPQEISYIHQEFTGGGNSKLTVPPSASYSINIIDFPENKYISASTNVIYQPSFGQKRYLYDIAAATETSLTRFISASVMTNDDLYIDTVNISTGDKIFSITDNNIYEVTASSQLITVSSSVGDIIGIIGGQYFRGISYIKTPSGFSNVPLVVKINSFVNTIPPNNR